jgi:hypothetical protein
MSKLSSLICAVSVATLPWAAAHAQNKPNVVLADEVQATAMVETVDYQTRTITLVGPRGNGVTLKVPDAAQNLDQVQAGDNVRVRYLESTAIYVQSGDSQAPSASQVDEVQLAAKGAPAGGVAAQVTEITAKVEGINYQQRWVHLRGPAGRLVKINVPESVEKFPNVHVGDMVVIRRTEAMALMLQKTQ